MSGGIRLGADALVQGLVEAGVEHVFGLPGDTGVDLYDSLARADASISHVMCRDERHAAIMADVYARCRNKVGVVEVSSGGGATYCVGGLGEPFAASVPLLVISSDIHAGSRDTGALTELDQEKLFSGVTKWTRRVDRADQIPALLAEAITAAISGRPGPVALILPEDVLAENFSVPAPFMDVEICVPAERQRPDPKSVNAVAAKFKNAKKPVIVAGGGVHLSAAYAELALLAETAGAPVATTIHGKGSYPEVGPWSLGVVGANGGRPYANEYLESADFVLFVGTRANATDTNSFTCPPRSTAVAQIDIEAKRAGRNYPGSIPVVGDAQSALADIVARLGTPAARQLDLVDQLQESRRSWRDVATPPVPEGTIHPLTVFRALHNMFESDAVIVADCGTATPYLAAHWETGKAGRGLVVARGHGPMGYAIPGAIGAAVANPGTRVLSVTTDGSLGMACGELETAARRGLPITFVQLTNGSYGWIKMLQHLYHDRRYFGVDLGGVNACAIAEGFGIPATRVNSAKEFERALKRNGDTPSGPCYIEVIVPDMVQLEPPVAPWAAALSGHDTARPVY